MENKPKRHGYITGYDPVSANIQKSKPFVTKKISGDYPKIEGEFKEEEYGQVPLKTSECVFDVPLLQKRISEIDKMKKRGFLGFYVDKKIPFESWPFWYDIRVPFGFGYYTKGLFWFRFKHNNKGFHIKNTKLHLETFSERMNIKGSGFNIGNWHFKWLKKYEG